MIKVNKIEFADGDMAVAEKTITIFNIPIYKFKETTTNNAIVEQLSTYEQVRENRPEIKGFC